MGRNIPEGMQYVSTITRKKRGRPTGSGMKDRDEPRTPFEALRYQLKLGRKEWAERLGYSLSFLGIIEAGDGICNVAIAKLMIEEARKEGIAITLDELYQHVIPAGMEPVAEREGETAGRRCNEST